MRRHLASGVVIDFDKLQYLGHAFLEVSGSGQGRMSTPYIWHPMIDNCLEATKEKTMSFSGGKLQNKIR